MRYSNNYCGFDSHQNQMIREIKSKHTILSEYLIEVLDYMRTQGIDINFNRIPSEFIIDGEKGTGWYGPIEGTIKNNNNDHELYADAIWGGCFNTFKGNEPILNLDTGGGNGGPSFNYFERTFISIDTLPRLKSIPYDAEIVETDTNTLNALIDPIYSRYYRAVSDRRDELLTNKKYNQLKHIIKVSQDTKVNGLYWIESKAEKMMSKAYSYYNATAERENYYELPPIEGVYTNTKNYYWKKLELNRNLYRFTEAPEYDAIIEEYNLFLEENAEKFI